MNFLESPNRTGENDAALPGLSALTWLCKERKREREREGEQSKTAYKNVELIS